MVPRFRSGRDVPGAPDGASPGGSARQADGETPPGATRPAVGDRSSAGRSPDAPDLPDTGREEEPAAPSTEWAWGADWSPEKADADRRERDRERLSRGISRSRDGLGSRLRAVLGGAGTAAGWEDAEGVLLAGDVGGRLSMEVVDRARHRRDAASPVDAVRAELLGLLLPRGPGSHDLAPGAAGRPGVVLVVGVNGTGKTTTIGKLAARERAAGRRVMLAAADTFRAAAIEQLRIWAGRAGADVVAHAAAADPGAVVFDALDAAVARGSDVVIVDTAGRLHTRTNLLDELAKIRRVIDKRLPGTPVETLFVLDATTGQNGLAQARAFHDAVGLTGIVLAKLDSTARGGIVFAIERELGVPVRYVGVGESIEDLLAFEPSAFVDALLA